MLATDVIERAEKRIGQTLSGKWQLDRVIGVGGMAAVYEATHRNRNRVAIKLLHPELSLDDGTRSRFLREGYVANTIRHPGAVQILDDDTTEEGVAFLVMELLQGESVEERIIRKGGLLEPAESLAIVSQVLEVLAAAHDQGVVHRDIKPDNLFLTLEGQLKVLDFGIARLNQGDSRATKVGSFMGTPAFCAPEQARGRWDEVDSRTDIYSVGATLFTMLTGAHVHEAETSSEQLALAISATARSLKSVCPNAPKDLVELVDMSLAYDKEDRFQTSRAMGAAVQRVLAGLPPGTKLSTPPLGEAALKAYEPAPPGPSARRRVLLAAGLTVLASGLLFAASRQKAQVSETEKKPGVQAAETMPKPSPSPPGSTEDSEAKAPASVEASNRESSAPPVQDRVAAPAPKDKPAAASSPPPPSQKAAFDIEPEASEPPKAPGRPASDALFNKRY